MKLFPIILAGLVLTTLLIALPISSAQLIYKPATLIDLNIPCTLNGGPCSSSGICNITINKPDSTYLVEEGVMSYKTNGNFNYTLTFPEIGLYPSKVSCWDAGLNGTAVFDIEITPTGKGNTGSKSATYILIFVVSFLIFLAFLIAGIYLPSNNNSDQMTGYIIAVSNLKYVKIFCFAFAYLTALFISYFIWMMSYAYLDLDFMTTIFQFLFYVLAVCTLPFFILFIYFTITNWVRDSKVSEMLQRGLKVRG